MQLQQNTIFADRYQLRSLIGRGGFSEVWLAHDSWTDLDIAIKVYAPGQGLDNDGLREFCQELASVHHLTHHNLLKPDHVDQWENMPYLIMEYCPKGALSKQIGRLTEEQAWHVLRDVATGLAYLHSNDIVHQDIKPDNILIDESGNYRITDFGISTKARSTLRKSMLKGSTSGGTMAYMGPERFSGEPAPIKASDIWSLGATLYELITGAVPFGDGTLPGGLLQKNGAEIPDITQPISPTLTRVIYLMLACDTWDRPTADTLAAWAANPTQIEFDPASSGTATSPRNADSTRSSKPTQRRAADIGRNAKSTQPSKSKPPKRGKFKTFIMSFLIILGVSAIGLGGAYIYSLHQQKEKERKERQIIMDNHHAAASQFDQYLSKASIDDIDALENAVNALNKIKEYEDLPNYQGRRAYTSKRQNLQTKTNSIYNTLEGKYQRAPSGSLIEKKLLEKRNRVNQLKQRI